MTGRGAARSGVVAATTGFFVLVAAALWLTHVDRRPEPILDDQFTHDAAPAVYVTGRLPVELTLHLDARPVALRIPVWIGAGRRPVQIRVSVLGRGGRTVAEAVTDVPQTGLAHVDVPREGDAAAPLRVEITSDAMAQETAPRLLWSRDPPRRPMAVRYAGRPLEQVDVLPATGPLILAEYPWPTRWLLALWLVPLALVAVAWVRGGRWRVGLLIALALAASVSSTLLWQRDYTRRAAHLDADRYAESAVRIARYVRDAEARPGIVAWFRDHPHTTTELVPVLLAPWVLLGVPVAYAYALLSALACWLALCVVQRVAARCLDVPDGLAWCVAAAMACHPLIVRTFARPVTDAVGLLLVVCTLWLLLRRMQAPGRRDELWLALLLLAHPLARPQGFGYWPFVALAMVAADRVREGAWPTFGTLTARGLRVFVPPLLVLGALYVQLDWWHNVGLMMEKARRFRIESTPFDFAASCVGVVSLVPLLAGLRRREGAPPFWADPRVRLLAGWGAFATALLVAVRAPFWLRHFLPVLPVVYWLGGMWIAELRGRARSAGIGLLLAVSLSGIAVSIWQVLHLEPLPGWISPFVTVP